jgi:hypothetical protein
MTVNIDFLLTDFEDPKRIVVLDSSVWGVAENQPAYLKVTPPGAKKSINLNFKKKSITVLNSLNLGLSCLIDTCDEQNLIELPDGVWEFCLLSSFENLDKKRLFLKDTSLRLELDKIYVKAGIPFDTKKSVIEELEKAELALKYAKISIKKGDIVESKKGFDEAVRIKNKYANCNNCF